MGFAATWAMAVGGMVGGGIFSVLGVVVEMAGAWAWVSFLLAGTIALITGHSYVALATKFEESGGAFTHFREIHYEGLAGALSWILIIGYALTISVYAFTFGRRKPFFTQTPRRGALLARCWARPRSSWRTKVFSF